MEKIAVVLKRKSWDMIFACLYHKRTQIHSMENFWAAIQHAQDQVQRVQRNELSARIASERNLRKAFGAVGDFFALIESEFQRTQEAFKELEHLARQLMLLSEDQVDKERVVKIMLDIVEKGKGKRSPVPPRNEEAQEA